MVGLWSGTLSLFSSRWFRWIVSILLLPVVLFLFFIILTSLHPPYLSIQKFIMVEGSVDELGDFIDHRVIRELFIPSYWDLSKGDHELSLTFSEKGREWVIVRTKMGTDTSFEVNSEIHTAWTSIVIGITPQTSGYSRLELSYYEELENFSARLQSKVYFESSLAGFFELGLYSVKEQFESLKRRQ